MDREDELDLMNHKSQVPAVNAKKKKGHHHTEVITTVKNGVKHVQITEVHMGNMNDLNGCNFFLKI